MHLYSVLRNVQFGGNFLTALAVKYTLQNLCLSLRKADSIGKGCEYPLKLFSMGKIVSNDYHLLALGGMDYRSE